MDVEREEGRRQYWYAIPVTSLALERVSAEFVYSHPIN